MRLIPTIILIPVFCFSCTDFESDADCGSGSYTEDPFLDSQWYIDASNHPIAESGSDANVKPAWDAGCFGQDVVVAVVDDGVDLNHEEFEDRLLVIAGSNYNDGDSDDPSAQGANGDFHGTSVAGIIAAANDGTGIQGIAPRARIMPIRLIAGGEPQASQVISAFYNAADNGADIINNSWGPLDNNTLFELSDAVSNALTDIATNYRDGKGVVITWAAGNGNEDVGLDGYAAHPHVMAIAASSATRGKSSYSDFGEEILVAAPSSGGSSSTRIWSTDVSGTVGYNGGIMTAGDYTVMIEGYDGSTGSYTFEIGEGASSQSETESGTTPIALSYPDKIVGSIEDTDDTDYYSFTFDGSTDFALTLSVGGSSDLDIYMFDADDNPVFAGINGAGADEFYVPNTDLPSGDYTDDFGGTSAAAPVAAAVLALLLSYDPDLTAAQLRQLLVVSSDRDMDVDDYPFNNGHSDAYGYGKINAGTLLSNAASKDQLDMFVREKPSLSFARQSNTIKHKLKLASRATNIVAASLVQRDELKQALMDGSAVTVQSSSGSFAYSDGSLLVTLTEWASSDEQQLERIVSESGATHAEQVHGAIYKFEFGSASDVLANRSKVITLAGVQGAEPDLYFPLR